MPTTDHEQYSQLESLRGKFDGDLKFREAEDNADHSGR